MSTQWIPAALRTEVLQRAGGRCEYCRVHQDDAGVPHEPDHIVAEQHGGQTAAENLAFACYHCNRHKGTNLASVDPESGQPVFLFHPRRDKWSDHFRIEGAWIVPLTPTGRATAALLKFDTPERLESRRLLARAGRYPV
ncbi:MAG: HNH endonuclease signature motif containing protein [Verrucomicrobiota bacterium]